MKGISAKGKNSAPHIRRKIFLWYKKNKRTLPWRSTHTPYRVLVSEIMLQQTQVDRVLPKYKEFLTAFPTVKKLASAKTADVIRAWKGLGYNRRALYLQKTAQAIISEYKGRFPQDIEKLKALPGIGDYTARAILAFAFGQSVPMMDTNHRRFYQRIFFGLNIKKDVELLALAEDILPQKRSFDWNQALMDFGSSVCTTKKPDCLACPVQTYCKAYPDILTHDPVKKKKRKTIPFKQTDRYVRGRIIDELRAHASTSLATLRKKYPDVSAERFDRNIKGLCRDGLILKRNARILLP